MSNLPTTMLAIVQTGPGTSSVERVPIPKVEFGSILIKVEAIWLYNNARAIYQGTASHFPPLPYPIIPGSNAIGRVAKVGPDTTSLRENQLVFLNSFICARDDPFVQVLRGGFAGVTAEAKHLYGSMARQGTFAEYVLAPLETTYALDEERLLGSISSGGLGYSIPDLLHLNPTTIVYASLRTIDLQAGEQIIITPATGVFTSAAVDVAVAMGARVIAASRNGNSLAKLKKVHPSINTVTLTEDLDIDSNALAQFGVVDAVIELSPPAATGANNLAAAVSALRCNGRVSLSGGRMDSSLPLSYMVTVFKNLTIRGNFMYRREDQLGVIKLVEAGLLKFGEAGGISVAASYGLEGLEEAFDKAVEVGGPGGMVVLKP